MNTAQNTQSSPSITPRRASDRGHANHGWLDSFHTFSFANYQDVNFMGFGDLRVINEDRVSPGRGFGEHGHRDMEIVSYPISGALKHRDSVGSQSVLQSGDVQVMSAGTGIRHSEMNGRDDETVHFLQIWIQPAKNQTKPSYTEKHFAPVQGTTLIVSPDGRNGSLSIGQDVDIHRLLLADGDALALPIRQKRAWVQVVSGTVEVNNITLSAGDGAALELFSTLDIRAFNEVEALVFDLR